MKLVLLTALGVGGATILGSVIGFLFKNITHKFSDLVLSFAAGVMLAAAAFGVRCLFALPCTLFLAMHALSGSVQLLLPPVAWVKPR